MADENKIILKGKGHFGEGVAFHTIGIGLLLYQLSDGTWRKNNSFDAANLNRRSFTIAYEDSLQGNVVEDDYATGDLVFLYHPVPGDEIRVMVKSGETVQVGDVLSMTYGGNATFEVTGSQLSHFVTSQEDSGGALAANTLMTVRVN